MHTLGKRMFYNGWISIFNGVYFTSIPSPTMLRLNIFGGETDLQKSVDTGFSLTFHT